MANQSARHTVYLWHLLAFGTVISGGKRAKPDPTSPRTIDLEVLNLTPTAQVTYREDLKPCLRPVTVDPTPYPAFSPS